MDDTAAWAKASPEAREAALYQRLAVLGIAFKTYAHPPVFTVAESAAVSAAIPGGHSKNLFLKDKKGGLWLVVVRAALRVDLQALARQLGAPRFSFGSAERLFETLAITPGSVTPFALLADNGHKVHPVLDAGLLECDPVNFHPLRNDRTTAIRPQDLIRFVEALGYAPRIAAIPEEAP